MHDYHIMKRLMKESDLQNVWNDCNCSQHTGNVSMYGLSVMVGCPHCEFLMSLKLKFGRPKTFEIRILPDNQLMGYAGVEDVRNFITHTSKKMFLPEGGADQEGDSPIRDSIMLGKLLETIHGDITVHAPQKRFEHEWKKINCDHEHIQCQLYGNMISLECQDCVSGLTFKQAGNGQFHAEINRFGVEIKLCGIQKTNKVFGFLRDNITEIQLAETFADRMSEDPDRDARCLTRLVTSMEDAGLLYRVREERADWGELVQVLSAFTHTRREFQENIRELKNARIYDDGKQMDSRLAFEQCWLEWPCWFESNHFEIVSLELDGMTEFCARCGHSTMDDDENNSEYWKNGYRECGYNGYLFGLDKHPTPKLRPHT